MRKSASQTTTQPGDKSIKSLQISDKDVQEAQIDPNSPMPDQISAEDSSSFGKLKAILGIMTKFVGVKDMVLLSLLTIKLTLLNEQQVGLRVSLPSQLLDPISNLEFWNYLDCPQLFGEIRLGSKSADCEALNGQTQLDRFLRVVRFALSKDVKFVTTDKIAKPYNSILGEQFICWYDLPNDEGRVWSITEQISHHPPVSAYYHYCPEQQTVARGVDQIQAKFSGTSVKVSPGSLNKGIFVSLLPNQDATDAVTQTEEYNVSHPSANLNGWLTFKLWISVSGHCVIRCPTSRLCALIEYKDEPFFGKAKFAIDAKIFKYDPIYSTTDEILQHYTAKNAIATEDVVCTLTGSWKGEVFYQKQAASGSTDLAQHLLVNVAELRPAVSNEDDIKLADSGKVLVKQVRPLEVQDDTESRKMWLGVSTGIQKGEFSEATRLKREIEDRQRADGKQRVKDSTQYESKWFGFVTSALKSSESLTAKKEEDVAYHGGSTKPLHFEDAGDSTDVTSVRYDIVGKPFLVKQMVDEGQVPWVKYVQDGHAASKQQQQQ